MNEHLSDLIKELIMIDSRNPFKIVKKGINWYTEGNTKRINKFLIEQLENSGFVTSKQFVHKDIKGKKHYNIMAEKGFGDHSILFYGHSDTVSAEPWLNLKDALTPKQRTITFQNEKRNCIVGLGSNDMKTGLAVICSAFRNIEPKGYKIKVVFGADEEFYSTGANVLAQSEFMDDVKAIVVPEIGDGPNRFYGHETLGIGRLGRCEFEISVFGTGGHGGISNDPSFISAAVEASRFALEFENFRKNYSDTFVFAEEDVPDKTATNKIEGSLFISKIDCGNESLTIPSKGRIVIDSTFTPNMNIKKIESLLNDFLDSLYKRKILRYVMIGKAKKRMNIKLKKRPVPYSGAYITPLIYASYYIPCKVMIMR
ncbi:MAG: M20/M25/M40 family metallo-hydrolase, partial [Candidatus Delongbacteria bacterium]